MYKGFSKLKPEKFNVFMEMGFKVKWLEFGIINLRRLVV